MNRKKRSDRRHIVYGLLNVINGEYYLGITQGFSKKHLKIRFQKHVRRALTEDKSWLLCKAIRKYGAESFSPNILAVVRGKATAHQLEREWIAKYNPSLNSM